MSAQDKFIGVVSEQVLGAHADGLEAGAALQIQKINAVLKCLERQHLTALADPQAKIPTALSLAIEAMLQFLPPAARRETWERDQQGRYDIDPSSGGQMRPGS